METTTEIISRSALPSPAEGCMRSSKCARHLWKRSSRQAKARKTLGTNPSFSSSWSNRARVSGASEARWAMGNQEMRSSMATGYNRLAARQARAWGWGAGAAAAAQPFHLRVDRPGALAPRLQSPVYYAHGNTGQVVPDAHQA